MTEDLTNDQMPVEEQEELHRALEEEERSEALDADVKGMSDFGQPEINTSAALIGKFFKDSSPKISVLDRHQIGKPIFTTGGMMSVGATAKFLNHPRLAEFLEKQALIICDTNCAKNGFFPMLAVTQQKLVQRTTGNPNTNSEASKPKTGFIANLLHSKSPYDKTPPQQQSQ